MDVSLTPRMALALQMCCGKRLADIGCDHGRLSASFLQMGGEHVYACDLNPHPLAAAGQTLKKAGVLSRATLILADGLSGISPNSVDVIAICGMGGELIRNIIHACTWLEGGEHTLVLQPMSHASDLRRYLYSRGYSFTGEALAKERDRLYCVMQIRHGGPRDPEENPDYSQAMKRDPFFGEYEKRLEQKRREIEKKKQEGRK